jgi:hypothetical protein
MFNAHAIRLRCALPSPPPEMSLDDKLAALESEELLLAPYATQQTFRKLKVRLDEIRSTLHRLRGLPLEPERGDG